MRLTAQELEQMKSVDIGAVSPESLPDVSGMTFDNALSRKERVTRFLQFDPSKKRAVTSVTAHPYFETKCPKAEPSLLSLWDRVII